MKELEALDEILIAFRQASGCEFSETNKKSYDVLVKALTPPTQDEVCRQLSEYYSNKFREIYDFQYKNEEFIGFIRHKAIYLNEQELNNFIVDAPHLLTLIGRFYQGVKEINAILNYLKRRDEK